MWPPPPSRKAQELGGGIFFGLMSRAQAAVTAAQPLVPLHLGDSYLPPPAGAPIAPPVEPLHRYGPIAGDTAFIRALADKLQHRNGLTWAYDAREIQVTAGATHALSATLLALSNPDDEILIPSPFWPLIRGIARTASVVPVEVPMLDANGTRGSLPDRLAARIGPKTRFLYVSSPNNPDGHVTPREELEAIVQLARAKDLWILSDEVYEDLVYDGGRHVSIASLPGAAAQTVSVWSFSKSYAQAGLRVGYVCAPGDAIGSIRRIVTHTIYNPAVEMQRIAHASLASGPPQFAAPFRAQRDQAVAALSPFGARAPMAGTFLFLDLVARFGAGTLERLADHGVLLAPGDAFGAAYGGWARLCYTAISGAELGAGLGRMAALLAK